VRRIKIVTAANHQVYIQNGTSWSSAYQRNYASSACLVAFACQYANMSGCYGTY
jgi:hypothetical protein